MADNLTNYPILSVCATIGSKLSDLAIQNGQLIFVQDKHKIALDYNGKRVFYNQIEELESELARQTLLAPISGQYYFVIDTAVFWTYRDGKWIQITSRPEEIVFIGADLPELGVQKTLYVDTTNEQIAVWNDSGAAYQVVSDKTKAISADKIVALFA